MLFYHKKKQNEFQLPVQFSSAFNNNYPEINRLKMKPDKLKPPERNLCLLVMRVRRASFQKVKK